MFLRCEVTKAGLGKNGDIAQIMQRQSHIVPTIRLSLPVATSQVSDMLVYAADSMMVGTLGAAPLAGVSLAGSASMIFIMFAVGLTVAVTPLAGEAIGRRNLVEAARYARAGLWTSTIVVTILVALLMALIPWFPLLGAEPEVNQHAIPYLDWILPSAIARIWFGSFKQIAEAFSNTRTAMMINIGTNIINVGLNWVFIYGNLGMPAMGAEGAGLATFIARCAAAGAAYGVYRYSSFFNDLRSAMANPASREGLRSAMWTTFTNGAGIGIQIVVEVLGFASGAIMMGWISATALAAHTIAINLASITFMIALGIGSAATIRVSNFRGEGRTHDAYQAGRVAIGLVLGYEVLVALTYAFARHQLPHLYIDDPTVLPIAATLLLWAGVFSLFDGVQVVSLGVLRGYNDIRVPTIVAAIAYVGISMPVGYLAAFQWGFGPEGIWFGYAAGLVIASIAYVWRIHLLRPTAVELTA